MQEDIVNLGSISIQVEESSILFLSKYHLHRVYCPFQVVCKVESSDFKPGEKVQVTQVTYSHEKVIAYQVFNKIYPHFFFEYKHPTQLVITKLS